MLNLVREMTMLFLNVILHEDSGKHQYSTTFLDDMRKSTDSVYFL